MKVYIDSPKNKEKLVQAFKDAGADIVSRLDDLFGSYGIIIPTVDETLPFFANSREYFSRNGLITMVANEFTINTCRDKAEFNLFCIRHGFQTPRTWQMNAFIKPRFGKGSKGILKVNRSFIIQEECPFPEVSIDYFVDWAGNPISIIPRYRLNIVDGESQAFLLVDNFKTESIERLGKELGLVGHNVIQGYWTGDTFIFGEVNPRFGGGSHLTFGIFNSPKYIMENTCLSSIALNVIGKDD